MEHTIRNIAKDLILQINEILNNDYLNAPLYDKAESIKQELQHDVNVISQCAIKSVYEDYIPSNQYKDFIEKYTLSLEDWKMEVYLVLEKINNAYHEFNINFLNSFEQIVNKEIQYLYKNLQYIIIQENNLDVEFVCHDSACSVCKFVSENNLITKDFIKQDDCDSYFVKKVDTIETDNLISNGIHFYNVPKKYKRQVSSFYKLVSLRYSRYIKDKIKIKFVQEFDLEEKYKDITDLIEYLYDNNENIYYIKFDIKSFQYYILKALNDLQEVPNEVKNYYYDKLHKDVIFSKDKFINYLAGQSPEYYYVETFIAYILSPDKLKQLDKKMFDYWANEIERR